MVLVDSVVVGMVSYRLFRLLSVDSITEPLRARLPSWAWVEELWGCAWCLGFWCTLAVGLVAWNLGWTDSTPWLMIPAASVVCGILGDRL